jgi:S-adenosylmethionine decarboxylase proenzyme
VPIPLGEHYIVEFLECDPERIATVDAVRPILEEAVRKSRATPVHWAFHQFEPWGMSATVLITESHICLHSWPDRRYMSADLFTCGLKMCPDKAIEVMQRGFLAGDVEVARLMRGVPG